MANKLKFSRGLENNLPAPVDGTVRFCTNTGSLYIDNNNEHIKVRAGKADQLTEKRTISLTGAITGAVEFDGSTDVIMNTMSAMESTQLIKDSEIAYSKDLPVTNVSKYATVTEIGGMTRKCTNLFDENNVTANQAIGTNGKPYNATEYCYSSPIAVSEGKAYRFQNIAWFNYYTDDKTPTDSNHISQNSGMTDTAPVGAKFVRLSVKSENIGSAMLNKGETAIPYEPYFTGLRDAKVTAVESVGVNLYCGSKTTEYSGNNITYKWDKEEQIITITSTSSVTTELFVPLENVIDIVGGETYSIKSVILENTSTLNWLFGICDSNRRYATSEGYSALSDITSVKTYTFAKDAHIDMLHIFVSSGGAGSVNVKFKLMLNKGTTALPYSPYFKRTFPIPEAVQALEGYGQGISKEYHNKIVLDPASGVKKFVKNVGVVDLGTLAWYLRGNQGNTFTADGTILGYKYGLNGLCVKYETSTRVDSDKTIFMYNSYLGNNIISITDTDYTDAATFKAAMNGVMLVYELATPTETDISDCFGEDNLIGVEAGGTIIAANEYEYDVPFTINYSYGKNYDVVSSKKFIGDLDGIATRAISDNNGNIIEKTYIPFTGGTFTGAIATKPNQYMEKSLYGLNMNNSDIVGINGLYFGDVADGSGEGLMFKSSDNNYDQLYAKDGKLYFTTGSTPSAFGVKNTVLHSGNYSSYALPLHGIADTATKLATARTIALSGDVTGSTIFDGSGNVSITATVVDDSHNHTMNTITNATTKYVNAGTVTRKVIVNEGKNSQGYISRVALGLSNPSNAFSPAILSVGINDEGTGWTDFTFGIDGSISSPKGNFVVSSGNIDTSSKPLGFSTRQTSISWGTLANSSYTCVTRWDTANSGSVAFADKDGQTSMQIDGSFYQNEGNYKVLDTSTGLQLAGGTMSGSIITPKDDNKGIIPHTDNWGQIGSAEKKFFRMYASTFYGNLSGTATKATQDGSGNTITSTYLKLSGGTLSGALGQNSNYLIKPVADFRTSSPEYTGAITIILPESIGNTMVSMWVDVYNYETNTSFSAHIGGYTYSNSTWANQPFTMIYGANHKVRLGHNGTNFVIYIGETNSIWAYPQITVRDVMIGYMPTYTNWYKNWNITFSTSFSNITYTGTHTALTTKNYSSYVLPISGGTMSGQIAFPNNSSLYPLSFSASNGGALVDTYGNFRAASTSAQTWNLMDSGGIIRFSVKWATGDTTIEGTLSTKGRVITNQGDSAKRQFNTIDTLYLVNRTLGWNANSYYQHVVLLLPVPTSNNFIGANYFEGKFMFWKTGGNMYDTVYVSLNCVYNQLNYHIHNYGQHNNWKLCVCTYGGISYYALKCPYHDNPYNQAVFHGHLNTSLNSGIIPQDIAYYDENSKSILNSEVYNSLTENLYTKYITSVSAKALISSAGGITANQMGNLTRATTTATYADSYHLTYTCVTAADAGSLPAIDNANGILTLNTHEGNYYHQLGFVSGDGGALYRRYFYSVAPNTTQGWYKILDSGNYSSYALPLSGGTLTGRLTASGKISVPSSGSAWVSGMALKNASIAINTQNTDAAYHPLIAGKLYGGGVWNLGTITNKFGFYGFVSGHGSGNYTDYYMNIDGTTGKVEIKTYNSNVPLMLTSPSNETCLIDFYGAIGHLGSIGFASANGSLVRWNSGGSATYTILDSNNYSSYALPLSGGTMTGPLNTANGTYNKIGDDVSIGDINMAGTLGIIGQNGNTAIQLVNYGASTTTGTSATGVKWTCTGNGASTISGTTSGTFSGTLDGYSSSRFLKNLGGSNYITINVGGNANTYYPIVIDSVSDKFPMQFINISRVYYETAPSSWNTETHKGGLTLTLFWNGSRYWDGNGGGSPMYCVHKTETYTTMVAGLDNSTAGAVVWLRGGGAVYHIHSMNGTSATARVYLEGFTDSSSKTFSPTTTISNIAIRWPGWSSGADSASNADKLDGFHGSASSAANTYILRDSSNYIWTNYIHSDTVNNENPAIGQVIVTNGSDGFYRKASLSHLKSSLGNMPASYAVCHDVRGVDRAPTYYTDRAVTAWFNETGTPSNGNWYSGLTVKGWSNGYCAWQLASYSSTDSPDDDLWYRAGTASNTWNGWRQIPTIKTVTGSGAVGTITVANNTEYRYTGVTSLGINYPSGNFECWLRITVGSSAITLSFASGTSFIGTSITSLAANTSYEISIKDKVVIIKKVG